MRLPQIHDFFPEGVPWFGAVAEGWNASARVVIMPSFGSAAISGGGDGRPRQPFYDPTDLGTEVEQKHCRETTPCPIVERRPRRPTLGGGKDAA